MAISRHAHHHADADIEFWNLRPFPNDSPQMPFGYALTALMAAVPPLWHMVMNRKIIEWDEKFASEEEKALAAQANLKSGQDELIEAAEKYLLKSAA